MMMFITLMSSILFSAGGQPVIEILDGYTNQLSAYPNDSIEVYYNASAVYKNYTTTLYTLQGQPIATYTMDVFPQEVSEDKPYENGFGYKVTKKIAVPAVKSGIYLWENKIPFIVKSHNPRIVVLYSSNTENAYNNAGGKSLYGFNSSEKTAVFKASFLRPVSLPKHSEAFLRWMDKQDFQDVGYVSDMDLDNYGCIRRAVLLIVPGHSEYWTLEARRNFDRFVKEGKNALVLSGNTMWWQVRYNKARNQLTCYRKAELDPVKSSKLKTINWNDVTLGYSILQSIGADFAHAGYGRKEDKGWNGYKILRKSPLIENTSLAKNDVLSLASDELDGAPISGFMDNTPIINYEALGFDKVEIVGYDLVSRGGVDGVATWIVFRPTKSSGIVINTASTDWCSSVGIERNRDIQKITTTMINKLLTKANVFSPDIENVLPEVTTY